MDDIRIEQIRFDLTWRIRHQVMYPDLPYDAIKLEDDEDGIHFGLYAGDQLTTVVSLFKVGNIFQFRKFATVVTEQGKGYGSLMLKYIVEYTISTGAEKLWCNARVSASDFYSKFGFTETNKRFRSNDLDFVIMELQLNN